MDFFQGCPKGLGPATSCARGRGLIGANEKLSIIAICQLCMYLLPGAVILLEKVVGFLGTSGAEARRAMKGKLELGSHWASLK